MSNPFFSINLRCPNCHNTGWYADVESELIVCDYCSFTLDKLLHEDKPPKQGLGISKATRRKLLDSLGHNLNK